MKNITTILLGFISTLLVAYLSITGTFMWRADTRLYDINTTQSKLTTTLEQQTTRLNDHETRIRRVERNTVGIHSEPIPGGS